MFVLLSTNFLESVIDSKIEYLIVLSDVIFSTIAKYLFENSASRPCTPGLRPLVAQGLILKAEKERQVVERRLTAQKIVLSAQIGAIEFPFPHPSELSDGGSAAGLETHLSSTTFRSKTMRISFSSGGAGASRPIVHGVSFTAAYLRGSRDGEQCVAFYLKHRPQVIAGRRVLNNSRSH